MAECLLNQQLRLTDEQLLGHPVDFSLKEADGRLNAAFGPALEHSDGLVRLAPTGALTQTDLTPVVDRVRQQIRAALPHDDYINLIRLLARFTEAL